MDLRDLMNLIPMPEGEPFKGETLRADGWQYRDLPRMTPAAFDQFVKIVGAENIRWLTQAEYDNKDGTTSKRGQLMISPTGFENMKSWRFKVTTAPGEG